MDTKVHPKDIVHPEMKIVSSFTHPHVFPNLYDLLDILNNISNQTVLVTIDFNCMDKKQ